MSASFENAQAARRAASSRKNRWRRVQTRGEGLDACQDCGEPIQAARRRVVPWATRYLEYQSLAERNHSRG
ncbi:TraR/DksA C4-type zinc finger protein [Azorhizobium doebereinerae]|uniref:TraR/DksA C4-type zinc finger protein n=1 Tax=Azorhizobium doebereinerae TaxID=281091 RepID=UPI0005509CB9